MTGNPEHQFTQLPLSDITIGKGRNPRKYFDKAALEQLKASIKQRKGLIQPIVVRPIGGGKYELVAGERRYRACIELGLDSILVDIRHLTDAEALNFAVDENDKRDNISVAEEAMAARQALDNNEGDYEETCKQLGWSKSKLDGRLLLLNASEAVLTAVAERKIKTGHAELLATLPESIQDKTLPKILEDNISVDALKQRIAEFALELSAARFDTSACSGCPNNSSTQASLFEYHVGDGRCSNHECWNGKVAEHIEQVTQQSKTEFNVVWTDKEKEPSTFKVIGKADVGAEQFSACGGCKNFGALVSTKGGNEGRVSKDVCFSQSCLAKKVKALADAKAEAAGNKADNSAQPANSPTAKKPKPKAKVAASPKGIVKAIYDQIGIAVLGEYKADNPHLKRAVEVALMISSCSGLSGSSTELKKYGVTVGYNKWEALKSLLALTPEQLDAVALEVGLFAMKDLSSCTEENHKAEKRALVDVVQHQKLESHEAFKVTDAFIGAHTKSGLISLCNEDGCGFIESLDSEDKPAAFKKLAGGKVDDFKKALTAYDFGDFVPQSALTELNSGK